MKEMKLAISVFEESISPRFDCAQGMLFIDIANGKEISRRIVSITGMNGLQQMKSIHSEGGTVIICGGMPGFYHRMAEALGIEVVYATGAVTSVIERIISGEPVPVRPTCCPGWQEAKRHGRRSCCGNKPNMNGREQNTGR